ncbi:MAG: AAA family ATPase, partial [Solobacterium sp.]|nr:AAA family ATPase [Solobacterium sp.]
MKIFKRKVYDLLKRWKETSKGRTALFLDGARRVGKTTIVKEFAENEYEDYLLLDFTKETDDIKKLFSENMNDLDEFYRILFLNKGKVLPRHQSVIILDEIQFCPPARQAIKHLVADGRYDFIETGSLISVRRSSRKIMIPSEEHKERMYPMDFEEFLWAIGDDSTVSLIRDNYLERKSLGNIAHRAVMKKFRVYMVVGGMPQAVCDYVEGKSYQEIDFTKREIISLYEEDLLKYDDNYNIRASAVFHTIPEQLMNRNSHFKMSKIDKSARYREYVNSIR